jgi:hypothetical protein
MMSLLHTHIASNQWLLKHSSSTSYQEWTFATILGNILVEPGPSSSHDILRGIEIRIICRAKDTGSTNSMDGGQIAKTAFYIIENANRALVIGI